MPEPANSFSDDMGIEERLISLPHADTCGVFYTMRDGRLKLARDMRELVEPGMSLDPRALLSVLQFGAIIPPLTAWREIVRLLPGYSYRVKPNRPPTRLQALELLGTDTPHLDVDQQAEEVIACLDKQLREVGSPAVLFSGGVDSGLLAARLFAIGRSDARLFHYSFGLHDPETLIAKNFAACLGMTVDVICPDQKEEIDVLERPGEVFPIPFADPSTVHAVALARAIVDRLDGINSTLLDGTGADGGFGMNDKIVGWRKLTRVPGLLRKIAGVLYAHRYWHRCGAIEYHLRLLSRSVQMPLLPAILAQNPLAGVLYESVGRSELCSMLEDWAGGWPIEGDSQRVVAADLALTCANTFVQKSKPVFDRGGIGIRYPFLTPEFVSLGIRASITWKMTEAKAPLKRALARSIPTSLVYRPKSGFADPTFRLFHSAAFIDHLDAAVATQAPLSRILHARHIRRAVDLLRRGVILPPQTLNCLWAVVFMSRWLMTVVPRNSSSSPAEPCS